MPSGYCNIWSGDVLSISGGPVCWHVAVHAVIKAVLEGRWLTGWVEESLCKLTCFCVSLSIEALQKSVVSCLGTGALPD